MNNPITAIRDEKGWTQEETAEYFGLSRESVNKMESGKLPISSKTLIKIQTYDQVNKTSHYANYNSNSEVNEDRAPYGVKKKTIKIDRAMSELYERMIRQESTTAVLKETVQNMLHVSTGKQAALISAELDEAIEMISRQRLALLKG